MKIIKIEYCEQCPHHYKIKTFRRMDNWHTSLLIYQNTCNYKRNSCLKIVDESTWDFQEKIPIPNWCELEDADENL